MSIALLALQAQCVAASLQDKICLVDAAQQLPSIRDMTLVGADLQQSTPQDTADALVKTVDLSVLTRQLTSRAWIDGQTVRTIEDQTESGQYDNARETVRSALKRWLKGGQIMRLNTRVAGIDVVFGAVCAWDGLGGTISFVAGVVG